MDLPHDWLLMRRMKLLCISGMDDCVILVSLGDRMPILQAEPDLVLALLNLVLQGLQKGREVLQSLKQGIFADIRDNKFLLKKSRRIA